MPGVPNDDEITAEMNKTPSRWPLAARDNTIPGADSSPSLAITLQDKWEDIRDAITDTEAYSVLSKRAASVNHAVSVAWSATKRLSWVLGTSALVLVVPLLYEIDKELGPGPGFDPASNTAANPNATGADSASLGASSSSSQPSSLSASSGAGAGASAKSS